jgi:hypothetical protein
MAILGDVKRAKKPRRTGIIRIGMGLRFMRVAPGESWLIVRRASGLVIGKAENRGTHRFAHSLPREFAACCLLGSQQVRVEAFETIMKKEIP